MIPRKRIGYWDDLGLYRQEVVEAIRASWLAGTPQIDRLLTTSGPEVPPHR